MTVFLWISSALHFVTAIYTACSVNDDSSNAALITALTAAFFAGAVIDAFAAIHVGDKRQRRINYVGGRHVNK